MEQKKIKGLTGVILSSADPAQLAQFYKNVLGIPLELNQHGNLPEHWECDFDGIHYAILKRANTNGANESIVLSFAVDDINDFVTTHNIKLIHPIMDLGNGAHIASFKDTDGNTLRLWMGK